MSWVYTVTRYTANRDCTLYRKRDGSVVKEARGGGGD